MLQRLLVQRGYQLTADGDYGPRTVAAVTAFQQAESIATGSDEMKTPIFFTQRSIGRGSQSQPAVTETAKFM